MRSPTPKPVSVGDLHARVLADRGTDDAGRWYWRAERRQDGRRVTVLAGRYTREEAIRALSEHVVSGEPAPKPDDDAETVRDLLELWVGSLASRTDLARHSRRGYEDTARRILRDPMIGSIRLLRLDRGSLESYRDRALRAGSAPGTVRVDLRVLATAWRWAREIGIVPDRELRPRLPAEAKAPRRVASAEEVAQVLDRLRAAAPPWVARLVWLLSVTGVRRMEACSLRWDDVDLERRVLHVGRHEDARKTGPRDVPLTRDAAAEIATWPREAEGVWGVTPGSASAGLGLHLRAACADLDVELVDGRALRRGAANALRRAGVDRLVYETIMGHSEETGDAYYQSVDLSEAHEAVQRAGLGVADRGEVIPIEAGAHLRRTPRGGRR